MTKSENIALAGAVVGAIMYSVGIWVGNVYPWDDPQQSCDCWEHKPMPFCEVLGSPLGGRIAVMPDTVVSTDP